MKYTHKVYRGELISDDRFIEDMTADHEQKREKLIQVCKDAGIELSLGNPFNLTFPPDCSPNDTHQIRSRFYLKGSYPEQYFYKVNQVYPMPLKLFYRVP